MKLYFTPQTLKKIIKLLLLFILISIIIFYTKTLNVQAKEFAYIFTSPYVYFWDQKQNSYANSGTIVEDNILYYIPTDKDTRQSISSMSYEINYNRTEFGNSFTSEDLVYFKGIIYFHSFFDVSRVKNFSFIQALTSSLDDLYKIYVGSNISDFYATIEDFDSYITIDSSGEYAYNEVLLFSLAVPYSKVYSYSSMRVGIAADGGVASDIILYGNNYGTIPTTNKNSFMQINQLVISDEEITMTLEDFEDPLNLIHYSPDDVSFPSDNEDDDDSLISRIIKNIINGIKDFGREVWIDIKTAFKMIFVPSSAYFNARYESLKIIFNQKFGIFIAPIDIFINFIERFLTLSSEDTSYFVINVPEYKIPGFDIPILKKQSYNLSEVLNNGSINRLWTLYLDFIDCFMIISFLNFSWNKLSSFFGGMSADNTYYSVDDIETYNKETGERISSNVRFRTSRQVRRKN